MQRKVRRRKKKEPIDWRAAARRLRIAGAVALALVLVVAVILNQLWQRRDSVEDLGWPIAEAEAEFAGTFAGEIVETASEEIVESVTATWLGISTVLFDDGETQILIDAAFTRVNPLKVVLHWPVRSDVATINYALATYRMNRLASIVPVHSHFDHAIDVGHVANRTSALVIGSESTANIAEGADVPVYQNQILADGEFRQFGDFTVKLVASRHAPIGTNGEEIFPGDIVCPLSQPASAAAYKTGIAWSVFVIHPRGTTLVQGSAGFIEGKLEGEEADVVMLSLAGLAGLGKEYTRTYWDETVVATGSTRIIPVHFDDFMAPFGEVRLLPRFIDDIVVAAGWIDEIIEADGRDLTIELPEFGKPIPLYPGGPSEGE